MSENSVAWFTEPVFVNSKIDGIQPSLSSRIYDINGKHTAVTTCHHSVNSAFDMISAEIDAVGTLDKGFDENVKSVMLKMDEKQAELYRVWKLWSKCPFSVDIMGNMKEANRVFGK